jgi:4-hydroxybenzoate polyprenyltransferase
MRFSSAQRFHDPPSGAVHAWWRALRVHQWSKNLLIFVPLVVGHAYGDPAKVLIAVLGFVAVCALSSATYIVNDIADLEADRLHPTKRGRPFASGELSVSAGLLVAAPLALAALIGATLLSPAFLVVLLAYLVLTSGYSFALKRIALFDVVVIGILFTLRIVMGVELAGLAHSPWLLSFAFAFFLSLALAKRHAEVMSTADKQADGIAGRGYGPNDWPITLTFGVGAGLVSIVIMLLYMTNDAAPSGFYHHPGWLYAIPALLTLWLMRIWLLAHRMQLHNDPVVFALTDWVSIGLGLAVLCVFYLAIW